MDYLPATKSAIIARYRAGMSLRRISEIYGGTVGNIEGVVAHMLPRGSQDNSELPSLSGYNDRASIQTKRFNALPPNIQNYAHKVVLEYNVPVMVLYMDIGHKHTNVLVRGCFFHGLNTLFGWSQREIAHTFGRSSTSVHGSIKIYSESDGGKRLTVERNVLIESSSGH